MDRRRVRVGGCVGGLWGERRRRWGVRVGWLCGQTWVLGLVGGGGCVEARGPAVPAAWGLGCWGARWAVGTRDGWAVLAVRGHGWAGRRGKGGLKSKSELVVTSCSVYCLIALRLIWRSLGTCFAWLWPNEVAAG